MTSPGRDRRQPENLHPVRIALAYAVIGLAWIFGSGYVVQLPILAGIEPTLELYKGTGFVLVTAACLYILLARRSRAIDTAQTELFTVDQQRARLVAAVEQSAEAIVITDTQARILYVNPAFERVSGYDAASLLGRNTNLLSSGQHDADFWAAFWATLRRGETWQGRLTNRASDGVTYEADSTITPVLGDDGEVASYVGVQHDTSRERALERHLAESGRLEAIGQLAGGLAHDFNNLLTVIVGHAQLLSAGRSLDADAREDIEQIVHASASAAALVRQLLAFSRRQILAPAVLDLGDLVDGLRPMLQGLLGSTIALEVRSEADPGAIFVDARQLEQVIVNLAVNARDAMPAGGTFTMTLSSLNVDGSDGLRDAVRPGRYALLTAADTGSGMDESTRARVFEPFFTTKPKGSGTGLGLATAYGIIRASGGYLMVESEVGLGSTFTVYLPHHDLPGWGDAAEPADAPKGGTETILVVEDEETVRAVIERTLRQLGYKVFVAGDATEAVELAEKSRPALLVTDVRLPGLDGPALAARVAAGHPGLAVLFVSGYAGEAMVDRGEIGEDAAFLAKPFKSDEIGRKVRELLDAAAG